MKVVVTFSPPDGAGEAIGETLGALAEVVYLPDVDDRVAALRSADAVLAWFIRGELNGADEFAALGDAGLLQMFSAGVDRIPFEAIPDEVPVASNAGAYAEPMAEHVLAMTLALAKRLPQNHEAMRRGEFDQQTPTRALRGATVAILGYGGIGRASARLFESMGARIDAVGRSDALDPAIANADVVVVALPLTRATRGLIGARELVLMKPDAILVNVARAAIVDEDALYEHLRANPAFSAGIDTWWQEPREGGTFATRHPFLDLPNVIGSPHNSALTAGALAAAGRSAAENIARHLRGETVHNLVDRSEY